MPSKEVVSCSKAQEPLNPYVVDKGLAWTVPIWNLTKAARAKYYNLKL